MIRHSKLHRASLEKKVRKVVTLPALEVGVQCLHADPPLSRPFLMHRTLVSMVIMLFTAESIRSVNKVTAKRLNSNHLLQLVQSEIMKTYTELLWVSRRWQRTSLKIEKPTSWLISKYKHILWQKGESRHKSKMHWLTGLDRFQLVRNQESALMLILTRKSNLT